MSANQRIAAASARLFSVASSLVGEKAYCLSSALAASEGKEELFSPLRQWNPDRSFRWHSVANGMKSLKYRSGLENPTKPGRKRVVFLGTGWAAMRFLPTIDTTKYEVVLVSPRNFFVFTPLLPSVCSGALSSRSCMEPIRRFTVRGGKKAVSFYEGRAEDVDFENDSIRVAHRNGQRFDLNYDALIVGIGSEAATFGIPGVKENSFFLKESENAEDIRRRVLENFETASLPSTTDEEKKRLLHFVCVGGGPSGVETAAEISDLVKEDVGKFFPDLVNKAKVSVIEMLPKVLPAFNDSVSAFTIKNFKKMNVDALLKTRVTRVTPTTIEVINPKGDKEELPCGFVLWASGIGQVPFAKKIMSKIAGQQGNRPAVMNIDESLRVKGVERKNVFALGDCSFLVPRKLEEQADQLFNVAQSHPSGAGTDFLKNSKELTYRFPQLAPSKLVVKENRNKLSKAEFVELLKEIDTGYKPPAPTAQNAGQEGRWLACMLNDFDTQQDAEKLPSFVETFRGALAYVGHGESVALTPWFNIIGGFHSTFFWKTCYWAMQMSSHNKALLLSDWIRLRVTGRDLSCVRTHDSSAEPFPVAPLLQQHTVAQTASPSKQ